MRHSQEPKESPFVMSESSPSLDRPMEDNKSASATTPTSVEFRYLKSQSFRVIHVDGAWGGVSPRADIHMEIFSERPEIPDSVEHEITPEGRLGKEVSIQNQGRIVREVEADVVMNLGTAKGILAWLSNKIEALEKAVAEAQAEESKK